LFQLCNSSSRGWQQLTRQLFLLHLSNSNHPNHRGRSGRRNEALGNNQGLLNRLNQVAFGVSLSLNNNLSRLSSSLSRHSRHSRSLRHTSSSRRSKRLYLYQYLARSHLRPSSHLLNPNKPHPNKRPHPHPRQTGGRNRRGSNPMSTPLKLRRLPTTGNSSSHSNTKKIHSVHLQQHKLKPLRSMTKQRLQPPTKLPANRSSLSSSSKRSRIKRTRRTSGTRTRMSRRPPDPEAAARSRRTKRPTISSSNLEVRLRRPMPIKSTFLEWKELSGQTNHLHPHPTRMKRKLAKLKRYTGSRLSSKSCWSGSSRPRLRRRPERLLSRPLAWRLGPRRPSSKTMATATSTAAAVVDAAAAIPFPEETSLA